MISLLTNIVLDATFGVAWWVTKNSYYGIKNGVNYLFFYTEEEEASTQKMKNIKDSLILDYSLTNKTDGTLDSKEFFISDLNKLMNEKNSKIAKLEEKIKLLEHKQ
jgi:hypothetical protein